jgi:hypothetical protein
MFDLDMYYAYIMTAYWNVKSPHSCHAARLTVSLGETVKL